MTVSQYSCFACLAHTENWPSTAIFIKYSYSPFISTLLYSIFLSIKGEDFVPLALTKFESPEDFEFIGVTNFIHCPSEQSPFTRMTVSGHDNCVCTNYTLPQECYKEINSKDELLHFILLPENRPASAFVQVNIITALKGYYTLVGSFLHVVPARPVCRDRTCRDDLEK